MTLNDGPLKSADPTGEAGRGRVPVAGLVGGMGAGKSWFAAGLAGDGAVVIDADKVGHATLEVPEVRARLIGAFGAIEDATDPAPAGSRRVDRKALGSIVFADERERRRLEAIVHPAMADEFRRSIREAGERAGDDRPWLVVLDAAILLEAGWDRLCDLVVFVDCPEEVRRERLRDERGWSDAEIDRRERAQGPLAEKRARADLVVGPFRGPEDVRSAIHRLREASSAPSGIASGPQSIEPDPEPASRA